MEHSLSAVIILQIASQLINIIQQTAIIIVTNNELTITEIYEHSRDN